jgi:NAD(P)-dependent dehydrogenase (short-subunit alcohol dehydrogenase family)
MRETTGRNASRVAEVNAFAGQHNVDLRAIEIDVASQASVDAAIGGIISDHGRLDAVVHNAGRVAYGPAEAFTPEQLAELFDTNVVSTQRSIAPRCRSCANRARASWYGCLQAARAAAPAVSRPLFRLQGGDGGACDQLCG